ncbi:MAG TPA: hypothetical protein VFU02_08730 [Polyangiaceae bacterium]|nr:hypothetical protein [Polyangiaceae bacterium]
MASQPTHNDSEEALEELDLEDAAVISHQSELHTPARRQAVKVDEPSVVVLDDVEPNLHESGPRQATRRSGRAMEPTLMIRDRRAANELRREMERRVRELKRQQMRSKLMWVVAGLFAFGLGGLLAVIVAKRQPILERAQLPLPRMDPAVPEQPLPDDQGAHEQRADQHVADEQAADEHAPDEQGSGEYGASEVRTIDLDVDR